MSPVQTFRRAASLALFFAAPAALAAAPNVVLIIADDVSYEDVGPNGGAQVRTPHLDALARDGMRFTRAFLTCSSCSPSRCSLITGRYPHATGAAELHQPLPDDQTPFPALLQQAGYFTAAAGKWHLGPHAKGAFDVTREGGGPSGCEHWVRTLQERPRDKPFFLWLAAFDAHRDYETGVVDPPHDPAEVVVPPYLADAPETRTDLALYYDEIARLDGYVGDVLNELDAQGVADETLVLFLADNGRPFTRCKTTIYDSGVHTPLLVRWPAAVVAGGVCERLVSSVDFAPTLLQLAGVQSPKMVQGRSFAALLADPAAPPTRDYVYAEHNWHDYMACERSVRSERHLYIRNYFPFLPGTPPADAVRSVTHQKMLALWDAGELSPKQAGPFVAPRVSEELYDVEADPHCLRNLLHPAADAQDVNTVAGQAIAVPREVRGVYAAHRQALADWQAATGDVILDDPTPDGFDRRTGRRSPGDAD